jgi:hypothetical protein
MLFNRSTTNTDFQLQLHDNVMNLITSNDQQITLRASVCEAVIHVKFTISSIHPRFACSSWSLFLPEVLEDDWYDCTLFLYSLDQSSREYFESVALHDRLAEPISCANVELSLRVQALAGAHLEVEQGFTECICYIPDHFRHCIVLLSALSLVDNVFDDAEC